MKKNRKQGFLSAVLAPVLTVLVLLGFLSAVANLSGGRDGQDREQLETALRRGAAACYAVEGIYPPDIAYLQEHYGIQIDEGRYTVIYNVFASNLMPDITVLDNKA